MYTINVFKVLRNIFPSYLTSLKISFNSWDIFSIQQAFFRNSINFIKFIQFIRNSYF